ncbi:hypothetical protein C8R44DRAFT_886691 [Mycena epipterygia]|nr:hypothetical protein C8R44DRAFT_886691 [Mycena epipterygia]
MPANPTPDFKMLPGIRDIFPEHFSPRRPQHPTEPRRAPLGPAPAENYFFGVLKHNPRSASLDDHKHNHPMPDPKRWYSQPVHAEDAEDTADGVSAKQGRGEEMDDRQSQAGSPYPSHFSTPTVPRCLLPADGLVPPLSRVAGTVPAAPASPHALPRSHAEE